MSPPRPLVRHWGVRAQTLHRLLAVVAVLVTAQLGLLAGPAMAAERVVVITADGPDPVTLAGAKVGDVVTFRNEDETFPHGVRSTSANWSFDVRLNPGQEFTTAKLAKSGTYTYDSGDLTLDDYEGSVVVGSSATAKPTPSKTRTASPRPSSSGSEDPTPSPSSTETSTGSATTPPLIGGEVPTPTPSPTGPPPVTAPDPTQTEDPDGDPDGSGTVALPGGTLPEPPTPREYGLPIAVATVGAAGTASLLARFLLAHPAGRRQQRPLVTLDGAGDPA